MRWNQLAVIGSLLARLSARTLPTNSSAVCFTATVLQFRTRCARSPLARLSARTLPTNSSAVCFTATSIRGSDTTQTITR